MELIGSIFFLLAMTLIVVLFVAKPFFQHEKKRRAGDLSIQDDNDHQRSTLLAERDRVLTALHELDFDYAMGKIPQEDYPEQRTVLLHTGAEVLRQLDVLSIPDAANGKDTAVRAASQAESIEDRIEAAVAARRADSGRKAQPAGIAVAVQLVRNGTSAADELEELIARRKRQRKESSAGFCPRCGKPVQKSDKFCSKCGNNL